MAEDIPRQIARTRRFTKGSRQDFTMSIDGRRIAFRRDGELWVYDVPEHTERRIAQAESYAIDRDGEVATLVADSAIWSADLGTGEVARLRLPAPAEFGGPVPNPDGRRIAYVSGDSVRVAAIDGADDRVLAAPDGPNVSFGLPDPAAWRSMGRNRGFWWSPDGTRLLVARVDESPVRTFHLGDPARPEEPPRPVRYPAAGTPNALVTLHIIDLEGRRCLVEWDQNRFEYLVRVDWSGERPLIVVQSRDQRTALLLEVDPESGSTNLLRKETDQHWVDIAEGTPTRTTSGSPVWVARDTDSDTYRLMVDDTFVTPPGLQVLRIRGVDGDAIIFQAQEDPTEAHLYAYDGELTRLSDGVGVHEGHRHGGTTLITSETPDGPRTTVDGHVLTAYEEKPHLEVRFALIGAGAYEQRTKVYLPSWHEPGSAKLPVLISSYAGPGAQRVMASRTWRDLLPQWFAEHGFVVLAIDGRGTPGRGPAFERTIAGDILGPILVDQIDALYATAERYADLDLDRVAMTGWSFSGYLSAAAVLHRPDVFKAGIAGAAVSDQRLYDTYWKERFLGHPDAEPEAYRKTSLLPYVDRLERPLMIVHGLADTNVWSLHALRFSAALTAAGKPHRLITLPGQGHRITDEDFVARLPHLELSFLREALGLDR